MKKEIVDAEIVPNTVDLSITLQGEAIPLPRFKLAQGPRGSKFTLRNQAIVLRAVLDGMPRLQASALAGIDKRTAQRWREKGEDEPEGPYGQFALAFRQADAVFMHQQLQEVKGKADANKNTWTAHMTLLERRFRDEFGRGEKQVHEIRASGALEARVKDFKKKRALVTGD